MIAYVKFCEKLSIFKGGFFEQIFFQFYLSLQLTVTPSFKSDHPNIQIQYSLNPQFELLPTVCDFIKQSLEL
jgi:hypothetical protein